MQEIERDTKKARIVMMCAFALVLLTLAAVYFFVRPKVVTAKAVNQSGLTGFSFERQTASGDIKCTMKAEDGAARVMLFDSTMGGKRERTMDRVKLQELQELIVEEEIYLLDGYYERGPVLGQKNAFTLSIRYEDEKNVNASGVTLLPPAIDEYTRVIRAYFYGLFIDE